MIYQIFTVFIVAVNLLSVLVCIIDKHKAKTGGWRISEKTLFLLTFIGGGLGIYATMKLIRHKTKHKRFMIGIPIIIVMQLVLIWFICKNIF
jgi:uncharacterized membrane protein YsdA (DUF1294 family)